MLLSFAFSFLAGSLTAISPCVLPAIPLIVGSATQKHKYAPLAVAAGMVTSFTLVGFMIASIGSVFGIGQDSIRTAGAFLLLLLGASLVIPKLQERVQSWLVPFGETGNQVLARHAWSGLGGQFLLGALLGLIWSPCTGPTLGSAIGLASQGDPWQAATMMLLFGVGASSPLLFIAYGSRSAFAKYRQQILAVGARGKTWFGGVIMIVGIMILTGGDKAVESILTRNLPQVWLDLVTRF